MCFLKRKTFKELAEKVRVLWGFHVAIAGKKEFLKLEKNFDVLVEISCCFRKQGIHSSTLCASVHLLFLSKWV